ncbi:MAG: phospho-N-acetylmuramoyl-pentapeptide-transferase, partial [Noviherbaspirillum sp.]
MLLWLAQHFQDELGPLRVFNFITFRAVFATLTALAIGLFSGPAVIRMLTRLKVGQAVRTNGPQTHLIKSGTPTMGGALILISIGVSTLLWSDWSNRFIWPVLVVTLGFGAIGWVDDYRKVVHKDPKGMTSREKYFWQSLIGVGAALYLAFSVSGVSNANVLQLFLSWVRSGFSMDLPPKADFIVPFFKTISYPLGVFGFITLTYFVI